MAKTDPLDSCSGSEPEESDNSEKSSSEEAEEEEEEVETPKGISDYEKHRLARIAENKARMGALGLGRMASSLMGSARKSSQRKGKQKVDEDEEYRPIDETDDDDDELIHDNNEDFVGGRSSSRSRKNKVKNRGSTPKKIPVQKHVSNVDNIEEDDEELMKAIALSLQDSANDAALTERKGNAHVQEDAGRKKRKKSFSSRQMTEDELVLNFFQFDEAGRGAIRMRDLRRVAIANDFTWTDMELADMIHCFDSDGDGKLNLDDFRKIAGRCNIIRGKSLMDTTSA